MRHMIKAKRLDNKEWTTGYLIEDGVTGKSYIHARGNSVNESDKVGEEGCLQFVAFEIDLDTTCKTSGLPDATGKIIYENDIIQTEDDCIGIVRYGHRDYHLEFYVEWVGGKSKYLRQELGYWANKTTVTGSVIDNPKYKKYAAVC